MRLKVGIAAAAVMLAVLLGPNPAHAKIAPSSGTIESDQLAGPVPIDFGTGAGDPFPRLVEQAGFFAATMRLAPDPMLAERPTADLGPALVVTWQVDEHGAGSGTLRQLIYPDAEGGPLTYTEPGQEFFDGAIAPGGWYRAPDAIVGTLTALGVPVADLARRAAPTAADASPSRLVVGGVIVVAAIAVGTAVLLGSRRRLRMRLTAT